MRRDNRRCAKAHRNEAVLCGEVGDKLQSCELKWFMASAKGDKFTPLCSTNHCSLMVTLLAAGQPVATCHTHAVHVDSLSVKHIGREMLLEVSAPGTEQRNGSHILSPGTPKNMHSRNISISTRHNFFCLLPQPPEGSAKHTHVLIFKPYRCN